MQSNPPKKSLMSHLDWNRLASSGASAKSWMSCMRTLPIWLIAPDGAVFLLFSLTNGTCPWDISHMEKAKPRMDRKALDLCGIATIGKTFIYSGGLYFIKSYRTNHNWFESIFAFYSAAKWTIPSSDRADSWGPLITAIWVSPFEQLRPILDGQTLVAYYNNLT